MQFYINELLSNSFLTAEINNSCLQTARSQGERYSKVKLYKV